MSRKTIILVFIMGLSIFAFGTEKKRGDDALEMDVHEVLMDPQTESPVVVLINRKEGVVLPIWIGMNEALAISTHMTGTELPRPMTHDLLRNVILGLNATVVRVRITEVKDNTFFARISLLAAGTTVDIDSRPSDAIALALRLEAPILVQRSVLDEAGQFEHRPQTLLKDVSHEFGLAVQSFDSTLARLLGVEYESNIEGLLVSDISPGSPASRCGMRRGDIILDVDGASVKDGDQFKVALTEALSGSRSFDFTILREGRRTRLSHITD